MEAEQLLGATLFAVIVGIPAYRRWQVKRSARRVLAGQCVRCGQPSTELVDLSRHEILARVPVLVCPGCAARTLRNHRWAFRAYATFVCCGILAAALGIGSDLRAGVRYSPKALLVIAAVTLGIVLYGGIFWRGAKSLPSRDSSGTV